MPTTLDDIRAARRLREAFGEDDGACFGVKDASQLRLPFPEREEHSVKSTATGLVKVTKVPKGEAPEEVRVAWVGLILPCYPTAGFIPGEELGVVSGEREPWQRRMCVIVPFDSAIAILERERPEAAKWWKQIPRLHDNLAFGLYEVEIVKGVKMQKIIEVTDDMRGDPYR